MSLRSLLGWKGDLLRGWWLRAKDFRRPRKPVRARSLEFEALEVRELLSAGVAAGGSKEPLLLGASSGAQAAVRSGAVAGVSRASVVLPDRYEWDNWASLAKAIPTSGSPQLRSLHSRLDVDWARFTLSTRCDVIVETDGPAGDTELRLFGPDSSTSQIAYDNDSGNGAFSRIERSGANALEPGTYYIRVNEYGSNQTVAAYTLSVLASPVVPPDAYEPDDTADAATALVPDSGPQTHNLHSGADVDWFKFTLGSQSDVLVETRGVAGDTRIRLYGPDDPNLLIASDDNTGVGDFSLILRSGADALGPGEYYVSVEEVGSDQAIAQYTFSVTTLQPGDVLLVQSSGGLPSATRWGESRELGIPFGNTYSHAAIYLGNNEVAEMLAVGFAVTPLYDTFSGQSLVDVYRDPLIGTGGQAVADAARSFAGTPYAYFQYAVLGSAAVNPGRPDRVVSSLFYRMYVRYDQGARRMICSELVARAYAAAGLALRVTLWPTMQAIGDTSRDFLMDFTTPTMLSLSPDLQRLNA